MKFAFCRNKEDDRDEGRGVDDDDDDQDDEEEGAGGGGGAEDEEVGIVGGETTRGKVGEVEER